MLTVHEFNHSEQNKCPDGKPHRWEGDRLPEIYARDVPGQYNGALYECPCGAVLHVETNRVAWYVVEYVP